MGANESGLSRQRKPKPNSGQTQIPKDFENFYNECKGSTQILQKLLSQCPSFGKNLVKLFPNALQSYPHFVDVVKYLRKYDPTNNRHELARFNIPKTTIVDRFFMICLGIEKYTEYEKKQFDKNQLLGLFEDYMRLFLPDPSIKNFDKILDFINLEGKKTIGLKDFALQVREFFPHTQKHLKDYYTYKFRDCIKNAWLLKNFKSSVIKEDAVLLAMKYSELAKKQIVQLYSTETCGLSFHGMEKKILGYTGHWLLIAEHIQKNQNGERTSYKFGAFQNGPISDINSFQGDLTGLLFSIEPKIRFMTTDKGENGSQYFYINSIDEKICKLRKGIGFGGTKHKENFKLWIDEDIEKSSVYNGNDPTYGFGALAGIGTQRLSIKVMQIWGLGSSYDLKNQADYWKQRQQEIMKRRKVNKKELIDGNAGLMFEKTFAHRDQVYGTIQRKEEQEDK